MKKSLLALSLVVCATQATTTLVAQSVPPPPNIVVILADDLGYGDVSFNGCPDFTTPNIDSLTNTGIRCSNAYVTHPFCSPSRAGLLTGRYQQRFGYENQPTADAANPRLGLPAQEVILPQILKPAGYVCGMVGKWHLGVASSLNPTKHGFDEFFGFLGSESPYYNAPLLRGTTKVKETTYLTDAFTREAVSFIQRHATQPFFLYLAYNAVHKPYNTPPANYMARVASISNSSRRIYAAMALAIDDGVGQVLQTLQQQNLLDNTLLFFLSDNGARQVSFTRNLPLRGYKFNVLDGGIHVPFVVQWPAVLPAGVVYDPPETLPPIDDSAIPMPESARMLIVESMLKARVKYAYSVWLSVRTRRMPLATPISWTATWTVTNFERMFARRRNEAPRTGETGDGRRETGASTRSTMILL